MMDHGHDFDTRTPDGIRAVREHLNLNMSVLAQMLCVSSGNLDKMERGKAKIPPVLSAMLDGLAGGFRARRDWPYMSGSEFFDELTALGHTPESFASAIGEDPLMVKGWTYDEVGPPKLAVRALRWMQEGWTP